MFPVDYEIIYIYNYTLLQQGSKWPISFCIANMSNVVQISVESKQWGFSFNECKLFYCLQSMSET